MRLNEPLDELLRSRSHVRLLRALDALPAEVAVSGRDLARRAGLSHPTASKVLTSLVEQGVVEVRRTVRADYYQLNPRHVLFGPTRQLFEWEAAVRHDLLSFLKHELNRRHVGASEAVLFGSAARGDMTSDSDIDLAVIVPASSVEHAESVLDLIGEAVQQRYGARLDTVIGAEALEQLRDRGNPGHRLWNRICSEGIRIDLDSSVAEVG